MNYDHAYHAGSFTDVFKHVVLVALIKKLQLKDAGFCYVDTHSGFPVYELNSEKALLTKEAQAGIQKLATAKNIQAAAIQDYLHVIARFYPTYPGSGAIVASLMRPQDTVILNEFMPRPHQALKKFFNRYKKVHCHQQNGYEILKALLPPKEKRGLIFIDPPYEDPTEFDHIIEAIKKGIKKFSTGVYAIWYPVKDKARVNTFIAKMQRKISVPQLNLMCCPWKSDVAQRLSGSGMLVINPPWKIDEVLFPAIDELNDIFLS